MNFFSVPPFMEPSAVKIKVSLISLEMLILIKTGILIHVFSTHLVQLSFLSFDVILRPDTGVH
jgi:hypothetical protein